MRRLGLVILCAAVVFAFPQGNANAALVTATWTGGGDNDLYSNPDNWDGGTVPANGGGDTYHAVIPNGFTVDFNLAGTPELERLSAGKDSTFTMLTGTNLTVTGETLLNGRLIGASGIFTAPAAPLTQSTSGAATFSVVSGSELVVPIGTYEATVSYRENWDGSRYNHELLKSTGTGSLLDLSTVETLDASFNDSDSTRNAYKIIAQDGGEIDLSSVTHITNPHRGEDSLSFAISGGSIDLSALETISPTQTGTGYTEFDIDVPLFQLPSLQSVERGRFDVGASSSLQAGALHTATNTDLTLGNTATGLTLPALETYTTGTVTLLPDTSLTAASLTAMDGVDIDFQGAGSVVATNLTQFSNGSVELDTSRTFTTGGLSNIDDSRISVSGGKTFGVAGGDITATAYHATVSYRENWDGSRYNHELLRSTGIGSLLDLSTVETLNVSFNDSDGTPNAYKIIAQDGGEIDLSSVTHITNPHRGEDCLSFAVSGGNVDLSALETISPTGTGTGYTEFDIDVPLFQLPSLQSVERGRFDIGANSSLEAGVLHTATNTDLTLRNTKTGLTLPALETYTTGTVTLLPDTSLTAASLTAMDGVEIDFQGAGSVVAPNLTQFSNGSVELDASRTFTTGGLSNIDESNISVSGGRTFGVSTGDVTATAYHATLGYRENWDGSRYNHELLKSTGTGSLLDLSTVETLDASFNDSDGTPNAYKIIAQDGGEIDFSGVTHITNPHRGEDCVSVVVSGGNIDLSALETISPTGTGTGYTEFDIDVPLFQLPSLQSVERGRFDVGASSSLQAGALHTATNTCFTLRNTMTGLTLPVLETYTTGTLTLLPDTSLTADVLTAMDGVDIDFQGSGSVVATNLTQFSNGSVELDTSQTFTTGGLSNIDDSRISVSGGRTFGVSTGDVTATAYHATVSYLENWDGSRHHHELLTSTGTGSLLDLSTVETLDAGYDDGSGYANAYEIIAQDGGEIDLSGVTQITNPHRGEDCLSFAISGGSIDLSALETISPTGTGTGYTEFVIDVPLFQLPSLQSVERGRFDIGAGASLEAGMLTTMNRVTIDFQGSGSVVAPSLTQFSNGTLQLDASQTFTTGGLSNIDDSQLFVSGGKTFGTSTGDITATAYHATVSYLENWDGSRHHHEILKSTGTGSLLDLSTVETLDAGYNDGSGYANAYEIVAEDGGQIDLSGLTTLHLPARSEDYLAFIQRSGGTIDLSSLRYLRASGSGKVLFQVESGGLLQFGHMVDTQGAEFVLSDPEARMEVAGSLLLDSTAKLNASAGAEVAPTGGFFFETTDESRVAMDDAMLHAAGVGPQRIEIGGEDAGVTGFTAGNFGLGQLVLGESGSPTSASLVDLYDNGNRGTSGSEALYLYGLGGEEGLLLEGGSVLTLNNFNVYAWNTAAGEMQYLNALFEPGEMRIPFDNGYLQLARMDVEWTNAAGGTFSAGANWDQGIPPAGSDSALWNLGSSEGYTVDFATDAASDAAVVRNDTVTFDLAGHEYSLGGYETSRAIVVGDQTLNDASLTIQNGTLRGRRALVGAAGATGVLTVGANARLIVDEDLVLGEGDAMLRVLAGGAASAGDLDLGDGGMIDLAGGTLTVGAGPAASSDTVRVHEGASLLGSGSIEGDLRSAGTLAPTGDETIRVAGDLALEETNLLELVYSGNGQPKATLEVAGEVTLGGFLSMAFPAETAPELGAEFVVMKFASVGGGFDAVDGIYPYSDVGMRLVLGAETLSLVVTLQGDLNGDGFVGSADLDIVRAAWGEQVPAGIWSTGDATGDGFVGSADLDIVRANWGAVAAAAVPEPRAMILLLIAMGSTLMRRR